MGTSSRSVMFSNFTRHMMLVMVSLCGAPNLAGIYSDQPEINRIHGIMFPSQTLPTQVTQAYNWGGHVPPPMKSLDDVIATNVRSSFLVSETPPQILELGADQLDSYWWVIRYSEQRAHQFLDHIQEQALFDLLLQLSEQDLVFANVLEKSFFQRDLYQIYSIFHCLDKWREAGSFAQETVTFIEDHRFILKGLIQDSLLSDKEFSQLKTYAAKQRPTGTCTTFHTDCHYVPAPVYGQEDEWYHFVYSKEPPKHFVDFQGRSFFKTYLKIPNKHPREIHQLVTETYNTYGENLTLTTSNYRLTPGTETLLIRTMGVHLENGYYADSGICEGFTMRIFTSPQQRFNPDTDDFRGTQLVVNTVRRKKLFEQPVSMGFQQVDLNAASFFGFYSNAPDLANSYSETITTTRYNCISCHSELHYGLETIFSLANKPPPSYPSQQTNYQPILSLSDRASLFFLNTEEIISIKQLSP